MWLESVVVIFLMLGILSTESAVAERSNNQSETSVDPSRIGVSLEEPINASAADQIDKSQHHSRVINRHFAIYRRWFRANSREIDHDAIDGSQAGVCIDE